MSKLIPFITVDNALEAIKFYGYVFDAKLVGEITMLDQVPGMNKPEYAGKVGHSTLDIMGSNIFINDTLDEFSLTPGDRIQLVLGTEGALKKAFDSLRKEGKVIQELHEVFWGALFGTIKDKFGVTWQLYYGHK